MRIPFNFTRMEHTISIPQQGESKAVSCLFEFGEASQEWTRRYQRYQHQVADRSSREVDFTMGTLWKGSRKLSNWGGSSARIMMICRRSKPTLRKCRPCISMCRGAFWQDDHLVGSSVWSRNLGSVEGKVRKLSSLCDIWLKVVNKAKWWQNPSSNPESRSGEGGGSHWKKTKVHRQFRKE